MSKLLIYTFVYDSIFKISSALLSFTDTLVRLILGGLT